MLGDWQLFWFQHNLRPALNAEELLVFDFNVNLDCMRIGMNQMATHMATFFIPAINEVNRKMSRFLTQYRPPATNAQGILEK